MESLPVKNEWWLSVLDSTNVVKMGLPKASSIETSQADGRRRNARAWTSKQQVDGLCVDLFLYVCTQWRMAGFYVDDDKHVIGLLQWLGWGVGHALLPLL